MKKMIKTYFRRKMKILTSPPTQKAALGTFLNCSRTFLTNELPAESREIESRSRFLSAVGYD